MALNEEEYTESAEEIPSWEQDLENVGFVRRAFRARKWYGADWWFVAISAVMVIAFLIVAFFPDPFAPFGPNEIVGASFLAPGETPPTPLLIVPQDSQIETMQDLAVPQDGERPSIGVEQGLPTAAPATDTVEIV